MTFAGGLRPFCLIDRYLLKEIVACFAFGLGTFTFVLMMGRVLRLMDLIIDKGLGIGVVLRLFLHVLPFSLMVTIPTSVLFAVLATYGRLSSEGEAIALKTNGVSFYRLMVPSLVIGVAATLATLWIMVSLQPSSTRALTMLVHRLYQTKAILALREGVFNTDYPGLVIYVDRLTGRGESLAGVLIIDQRNPAEHRVVIAKEGKLVDASNGRESRSVIHLSQGNIHTNARDSTVRHRNLTFETYDLQIPTGGRLGQTLERPKKGQEMALGELRAHIERLKKEGGQVLPLQVEWHKKFALPVACLILVLIGSSVGFRLKKASRGLSVALSVAFAVFYYILFAAGESLGARGRIDPAFGVWYPNLLLALIAIGLVLREGREGLLTARPRSVPGVPEDRPRSEPSARPAAGPTQSGSH